MPTKRSTAGINSQSGGGMSGGHKHGDRTSNASAGGLRPSQSGNPGLRPSQSGNSTGLRPSQSGNSTGLRPSQPGNSTGLRPSLPGNPTGGSKPSQPEGLSPEWAGATSSSHQRSPQVSSKKGQGQHRWGSAAPSIIPPSATTGNSPTSAEMPVGVVLGALTNGGASTCPSGGEAMVPSGQDGAVVGEVATGVGGQLATEAAGKHLLLPEQFLPKVIWKSARRKFRGFDIHPHV